MDLYNNHLMHLDNYSEYIRELIYKDLLEKRDPEIIKTQIKEHKDKIKKLEDLLKSPHPMMKKAMDLLSKHAKRFKELAPHRTQEQKHNYIENVLMPNLSKFGFNKSVEEIEEILLKFPEDDGHE